MIEIVDEKNIYELLPLIWLYQEFYKVTVIDYENNKSILS